MHGNLAHFLITSEEITGLLIFFGIILCGILAAFIISRIFRSRAMRHALWHKSPFLESGGTGHMPDLSPVEAGIIISVDISRLLTIYLFELMCYKDIKIVDASPLKVENLAEGESPPFRKRFLDSIGEDGTLSPDKMLLALDFLYNNVKNRIGDYGVKETVIHYLDKVDALWDEIQKERTTSAKLETLQENFSWLMLHEDAADNLEQSFKRSAHWPTVQPIVRIMRHVRTQIIDNEDILEHAANYQEGIFSNKSYLEGIMDWAREFIMYASYQEMRKPVLVMPIVTGKSTEELQESIEKRTRKLTEKLNKLQHLLEVIEDSKKY